MKILCIYSFINFVCLSKTSQWRKLCLNVNWHLWEVFFLSAHLLARSPAHTHEAWSTNTKAEICPSHKRSRWTQILKQIYLFLRLGWCQMWAQTWWRCLRTGVMEGYVINTPPPMQTQKCWFIPLFLIRAAPIVPYRSAAEALWNSYMNTKATLHVACW